MMNGQQTVDGSQPVTITLPLGAWQQLMQALIDIPIPWKVTNPLIVAYERQVQEIIQRSPPAEAVVETPRAREGDRQ